MFITNLMTDYVIVSKINKNEYYDIVFVSEYNSQVFIGYDVNGYIVTSDASDVRIIKKASIPNIESGKTRVIYHPMINDFRITEHQYKEISKEFNTNGRVFAVKKFKEMFACKLLQTAIDVIDNNSWVVS